MVGETIQEETGTTGVPVFDGTIGRNWRGKQKELKERLDIERGPFFIMTVPTLKLRNTEVLDIGPYVPHRGEVSLRTKTYLRTISI